MITVAPDAKKHFAISNPIPVPPPVMSATRPCNEKGCCILFFYCKVVRIANSSPRISANPRNRPIAEYPG